jgi:hypothetical protein
MMIANLAKGNPAQWEELMMDFGSTEMICLFFRITSRTLANWKTGVPLREWDKYTFWKRGRPQPDWMPPKAEWPIWEGGE